MSINLAENKSKRVEILRVGKFERRFENDLEITLLDLQELKQNFDSNARRQVLRGKPALPFNFSHDCWAEAAGWIISLEIGKDSNNFDALFAGVEWTEKGAQKIKANEFKFVSSEFSFNFKDPETGKIFDIILGGAALTNIPFIRDMEAVQLSENKNGQRTVVSLSLEPSGDNPDTQLKTGGNMPTFDEVLKKLSLSPENEKQLREVIQADNKQLSEKFNKSETDVKKTQDKLNLSEQENKNIKEKMSDSTDMEDKLKLSLSETKTLKGEVAALVKNAAQDKKKSGFDQMLSEGKVCEAQREPYMKDDMTDFAKKQEPVKLDEAGENDKGDKTLDGSEEKVAKLTEAKIKEDKSLDYGTAMKVVLSENFDLKNKLGQ